MLAPGAMHLRDMSCQLAVPTEWQTSLGGTATGLVALDKGYCSVESLVIFLPCAMPTRGARPSLFPSELKRRTFCRDSPARDRWMRLEAKQDGVQQAQRLERDGMFSRRAQPSPDGRKRGVQSKNPDVQSLTQASLIISWTGPAANIDGKRCWDVVEVWHERSDGHR